MGPAERRERERERKKSWRRKDRRSSRPRDRGEFEDLAETSRLLSRVCTSINKSNVSRTALDREPCSVSVKRIAIRIRHWCSFHFSQGTISAIVAAGLLAGKDVTMKIHRDGC